MSIRFCAACQASIISEALFCGNCGAQTDRGRELQLERQRHIRSQMSARGSVIAFVFAGSLLAMTAVALGLNASNEVKYLVICALDLLICFVALRRLGPGSIRPSLGRAPDPLAIGLAIAVPVVSLAVAYGYVGLLSGDGAASSDETVVPRSVIAALFFTAVLPALVEEWMCRGVLWIALRPITTNGITIFATAALFAFLHGLNGGFILELPHRFVMGLLLGWLRARTGSLWPCVLAHFLHNGFVVATVT